MLYNIHFNEPMDGRKFKTHANIVHIPVNIGVIVSSTITWNKRDDTYYHQEWRSCGNLGVNSWPWRKLVK